MLRDELERVLTQTKDSRRRIIDGLPELRRNLASLDISFEPHARKIVATKLRLIRSFDALISVWEREMKLESPT